MKQINCLTIFSLVILLFSLPTTASVVIQFDFKVETKTKQKLLKNTTEMSLTSLLTLKLLQKDKLGEWWGIKADDVRLNEMYFDASYELPFAFYLNNNGLINSFWFPNGLSNINSEKLKGLAYYFQWQHTEQAHNLTEQDNTGIYTVKYMTAVDGKITKEKLSYQKNNDYQIKILHSHNEILKATNFFENSSGKEEFLFAHDVNIMNIISKQRYEIKVRDLILPSTLLDLPNDLSLWSIESKKEKMPTDDEIKFQRLKLIQILANQDLTRTSSSELALKLLKFTDGIDVIELMIVNGQIQKTSLLRLFNALGQIDNKNSQFLLSNIIKNNEINDNAKFLAIRALTNGHAALTLQTTKNILNLLEDGIESDDIVLKSSLIHGVGSILGQRTPNQFSEDIKSALLAKIKNESSDKGLSTLISSIGNTKDPTFIVDLEKYKDSTSSQIRSSLAESLGLIESENSHTILTQMLTSEVNGNSRVQSSILKSLKNYPINNKVISLTLNYIDKSTSDDVRFDAIDLIAKKNISKKHKSILNSLMMKETNKKNFIAIANLLNEPRD